MRRHHRFYTVTLLTISMAAGQTAGAAAQTPTDRRTTIGASVFLEMPSFGYSDPGFDEGGPRGLSPGVSIHISRALSNRVGVGLEIDFAAAHVWRGTYPWASETMSVNLPRVTYSRFDTFSPVLMYRIGATGGWTFNADGGLAFAHVRSGDVKPPFPPAPSDPLVPTATEVSYSVGVTAGVGAQLDATRRLAFVASVRVTSLSFFAQRGYHESHGFVIRPGAGIRLKF